MSDKRHSVKLNLNRGETAPCRGRYAPPSKKRVMRLQSVGPDGEDNEGDPIKKQAAWRTENDYVFLLGIE
jgi:hypothetical protein